MKLRKADVGDVDGIMALLYQVAAIHHDGRPDLFREGASKYTADELAEILDDSSRPVLVAVDDGNNVRGYAFCVLKETIGDNILTDIRTLYLDDLCIDGNFRGKGIGTMLFESVKNLAREKGCYNVTLNVWSCNGTAMEFYRKCGLVPQKTMLETIL